MSIELSVQSMEKATDTKLRVTKACDPTSGVVSITYELDREFIEAKRANLISDLAAIVARKQVEIDELTSMLDRCDSLGITVPEKDIDIQPIGGDTKITP